jgi:hypothetical protein
VINIVKCSSSINFIIVRGKSTVDDQRRGLDLKNPPRFRLRFFVSTQTVDTCGELLDVKIAKTKTSLSAVQPESINYSLNFISKTISRKKSQTKLECEDLYMMKWHRWFIKDFCSRTSGRDIDEALKISLDGFARRPFYMNSLIFRLKASSKLCYDVERG